MNKLLLLLFVLFSCSGIKAQKDAPTTDTLRNMIAVAPVNTNLFGTSNMIYYKRFINQMGPYMIYYRAGIGLFDRFTNEDDADRLIDPVSPDRRSINFNFGLEWYRPAGDFSITFGPELGYTRASFFEDFVTLEQGRVFSLEGLATERNFALEKSFYRSYNLAWFVGLRYHIGRHFQFGIESALGWSFYRLENQYVEVANQINPEFTGIIRELAIGRHFILEVNF
jgi:hypothetical protein